MRRAPRTKAEARQERLEAAEETNQGCVFCGGEQLELLGCLGHTAHYRCRNCGGESYRRAS